VLCQTNPLLLSFTSLEQLHFPHTSQTMAFQSNDNNNGAYATGQQQQQQTGFGQGPTDRAANAVPVSTRELALAPLLRR